MAKILLKNKRGEVEMQILIVDLGSQYTALIGRQIRDLGVRSETIPPEKAEDWLKTNTPKGIVLSGGTSSIYDENTPQIPDVVFAKAIPILGICLGMHALIKRHGGIIERDLEKSGYGEETFTAKANELFEEMPTISKERATWCAALKSMIWESHGDSVAKMPEDFEVIGVAGHMETVAAIKHKTKKIWGLQFHPEVEDTQYGKTILKNFLGICKTERDWKPENLVEEIRESVIKTVPPGEKAVLGFSGGVDSSVLAAILEPALGMQLMLATIDIGQLREGEQQEITARKEKMRCQKYLLDATQELETLFSPQIANILDAEKKRAVFKKFYKESLERLAKELGITYLLQGTLKTDLIESAGAGKSAKIKSHHNVGINSSLKQLHPLGNLFKHEVRDIARSLELPKEISERMPFPGPGLICRIVNAYVTKENLRIVRWADQEVTKILETENTLKNISQLVVALLGVRMVGVKGDGRTYGFPVAVRAVQTLDFMTCRGYEFPLEVRRKIKKALVKHKKITRVLWDENDKPPATVEFE